jgi:hypothetical protein
MNGATVETNVYAAFSQHLSLAQAKKLSVLDDGEGDGLLSRWVQVCADRQVAVLAGGRENDARTIVEGMMWTGRELTMVRTGTRRCRRV